MIWNAIPAGLRIQEWIPEEEGREEAPEDSLCRGWILEDGMYLEMRVHSILKAYSNANLSFQNQKCDIFRL